MDDLPAKTKRRENRKYRNLGLEYTTVSGKRVCARNPPSTTLPCKCSYDCHFLSHKHRKDLFIFFRSMDGPSQKAYISNFIDILPVQRRRGKSSTNESSRRQVSVCYRLVNEEGKMVHVCRASFIDTFGISKKSIEVMVKHKKAGIDTTVERRGGRRNVKFTEEHRELVYTHIMSIPREENHFALGENSEKEYLAAGLCYSKLHTDFMEKYPNSQVTISFYKEVFKKDFPNLRFGPASYEPSDCLRCKIEAPEDDDDSGGSGDESNDHHWGEDDNSAAYTNQSSSLHDSNCNSQLDNEIRATTSLNRETIAENCSSTAKRKVENEGCVEHTEPKTRKLDHTQLLENLKLGLEQLRNMCTTDVDEEHEANIKAKENGDSRTSKNRQELARIFETLVEIREEAQKMHRFEVSELEERCKKLEQEKWDLQEALKMMELEIVMKNQLDNNIKKNDVYFSSNSVFTPG